MSIIILIGPSGSGKDTIGDILKERGIAHLISFTTRDKRKGEKDGIGYHFVKEEEMDELDIVQLSSYAGNHYGLLKQEVDEKLSNNRDVYFISNVEGSQQVSQSYPGETIIFWLKIDLKTMEERMLSRGDSGEKIKERLDYARSINETERPDIDGLIELDAINNPEDLANEIMDVVRTEKSALSKS